MVEKAYAKINLGLKILGKRPDGYHDILTVMQTVSLHDTLILKETSAEIILTCSDPDIPCDERNLVYRAALALKRRSRVNKGAHIVLDKQIPSGAGLGGGSSDAASTLRALTRLWDLKVTPEILYSIAASLGADVPFFLQKGTAIARGKGEILEYINWPEQQFYVLVYPGYSVSTRWAYDHWQTNRQTDSRKMDLTFDSKYVNFIGFSDRDPSTALHLYNVLENDFEEIVGARYPEILEVKAMVLSCGAFAASMSGSGSTVYGAFESEEAAQQAATSLTNSSFRVFMCSSLP